MKRYSLPLFPLTILPHPAQSDDTDLARVARPAQPTSWIAIGPATDNGTRQARTACRASSGQCSDDIDNRANAADAQGPTRLLA